MYITAAKKLLFDKNDRGRLKWKDAEGTAFYYFIMYEIFLLAFFIQSDLTKKISILM